MRTGLMDTSAGIPDSDQQSRCRTDPVRRRLLISAELLQEQSAEMYITIGDNS